MEFRGELWVRKKSVTDVQLVIKSGGVGKVTQGEHIKEVLGLYGT